MTPESTDSTTSRQRPDLGVSIGPLRLANPLTAASGTYGYAMDYTAMVAPATWGAIFLKGLTLEPREGNPPPRLVETPSGLLNAIGLQNVGVEEFLKSKAPVLEDLDTVCIATVCGAEPEQYVELARRLEEAAGIAALELNFSCPNVKAGCMAIGSDPALTEDLTRRVGTATRRPVIVKLSPNVADIAVMARAAEAGGAAAISLPNTFLGLAVDVRTRRPRLGNVTGGLSGPAIRPLAVRLVWEAARAVTCPVIGQGGIQCAEDALEFLIAGASAVSVGTANFVNPAAPVEILDGIERYLIEHRLTCVADLVGTLETLESHL